MNYLKRILSLILVVVTIFLVTIPVNAEEYTSNPTFWEYQLLRFIDSGAEALDTWVGTTLQDHDIPGRAVALISDDICSVSPDGLHHCTSEDLKLGSPSDNNLGVTACMGSCDYCGEEFLVTGDDLGAAYQQALKPTTGSLFSLIRINADGSYDYAFTGYYPTKASGYSSVTGSLIGYSESFTFSSLSSTYGCWILKCPDSYIASYYPFSGDYSLGFESFSSSYVSNDDYFRYSIGGTNYSQYLYNAPKISVQHLGTMTSGSQFLTPAQLNVALQISGNSSVSGRLFLRIKPANGIVVDVGVPTIGSITGDVVVIGDNNETTVYENCQFVDETNNQYFNPTTNAWNTYNSYSYDYSTMTYNFVTDVGNTTINYGDEYISISETVNNVTNVYNYYYYVETEPADPDTCEHTYTSEITREPSCTVPGLTTYTCSKCGKTYTATIDPLGHDWLLTDSVETTYTLDTTGITCPTCNGTAFTYTVDENGLYTFTCSDANCAATWTAQGVTNKGYDLYTCSRCGETYKDYSGSGPPDENDGIFAAIGDFIADGIQWILDKLAQLVESFNGITTAFTEYTTQLKDSSTNVSSFLKAAFEQIPSSLLTLVWFFIVSIVLVCVYRKFFK